MIEWMVGLALFLLMLAFIGALADSNERRDARRRNHVSRRR